MLQYKVMEMGLNKELLSIKKTQQEIKHMQGIVAGSTEDQEDEDDEEEGDEEEPKEADEKETQDDKKE